MVVRLLKKDDKIGEELGRAVTQSADVGRSGEEEFRVWAFSQGIVVDQDGE